MDKLILVVIDSIEKQINKEERKGKKTKQNKKRRKDFMMDDRRT